GTLPGPPFARRARLAMFFGPLFPNRRIASLVVQDYLSLVRSQDLEALETAWNQATADPGNVDRYCQTLKELGSRGELGTALELGSRMLDALEQKGRAADAVKLGTTLLAAQARAHHGHSESLARKVLGLVEKAFSDEAWFQLAKEASGLGPDNLSPAAFQTFDMARRFTPGHVVYHRAGWNEGVVEELDVDARSLR